jgi:PAP2 superfamily
VGAMHLPARRPLPTLSRDRALVAARRVAHPPSLRALGFQAVLFIAAALAYFGVRHITQGNVDTAVANARDIVDAERASGIDVEDRLQGWVVDRPWLRTATNWVYIWGHWPVVVGTLFWLHTRRPDGFRTLRNAMFISGAIGLIIFAAYPVAPPRLADIGAIDTVTLHSSSYRALQPPELINKYAAMPSLHFGWNLLVGIALLRAATPPAVRAFAVVSPIVMAFAVVATGNHFVLDAAVGGAVALVGLACAVALDRWLCSSQRGPSA